MLFYVASKINLCKAYNNSIMHKIECVVSQSFKKLSKIIHLKIIHLKITVVYKGTPRRF